MIGGLISTALSSGLENVFGNGLISSALCTGAKKDDMIFEIEVYTPQVEYTILYITANSIFTTSPQKQILYNLRDMDGNRLTPENNPELFTDNPLNNELLQSDLVEHNKAVQLIIDWGDGEKTIFDSVERTHKDLYKYDTINTTGTTMGKHTYTKVGKYTVKVSGVCTQIYISDTVRYVNGSYNFDTRGWRVKKLISLGNLDNTMLYKTFAAALMDKAEILCGFDFKLLERVRSVAYVVYNARRSSSNITIEEYFENYPRSGWDIVGGDDFFHHFSKLVAADSAMYYGNIPYVPAYCFADNPYLQSLNTCFAYNPLKYVGAYACANLTFLTNANSIFTNNLLITGGDFDEIVEKWDKYIGCIPYTEDGIFENCVNLTASYNFNIDYTCRFKTADMQDGMSVNMLGKLGNKIFKNCKSLPQINLYNGYLLNSIGDGAFENCENLQTIALGGDSACFEYLGKDVFKNCKKIYSATMQLALNAALPFETPDNLFYDIEFQEGKAYDFKSIRMQYAGRHSMKSELCQKDICVFLNELNNWNSFPLYEFQWAFIKKYMPDIAVKLEEIKADFPNKYYIKNGKNMFNETFLKQWGNDCKSQNKTMYTPLIFGQCFEIEVGANQYEMYNVNCGEAAPFWKYTNPKTAYFGSSYYGQEMYVSSETYSNYTTPLPVHYDNKDEIPYLLNTSNGQIAKNGYDEAGIGYYVSNNSLQITADGEVVPLDN